MIRVSFPGERGAYSEAAAVSFFAGQEVETVPHLTFAGAMGSTVDGDTDYTILPVENSIEGSVGESYDLLTSTPLVAAGEIHHRIRHCLIGYGRMSDVKQVWSHPQALGQCRRFLEEREMRAVSAYDTAGSIKNVRDAKDREVAGIASKEAAELYGVPVIAEDIADNSSNYTRFLILAARGRDTSGLVQPPSGAGGTTYKTSITLSIKHEPGSLYRVIKNFYENNVNMTKIESRPTRGNAWEYNFYVDFEGHAEDPRIAGMLERICSDSSVRVLGSYPSAAPPPVA
ncbi:MAG: prephenate dehydratase [Nitrosopumilaceae archaeon]|nr:prephenate dehydratase [Nitrosopumilaceae archaeon]